MKLAVIIYIDEISDKFEIDDFSMNGFWVIALDLVKTRQNWLVNAIETTVFIGFE